MAVKNYMINDKWLDIAKQNIVEVESADGVIGSVKVNGQEYGGGGGSSDFSTANLTITNTTNNPIDFLVPNYKDGEEVLTVGLAIAGAFFDTPTTETFNVACKSDGAVLRIVTTGVNATISGNIQYIENQNLYIIKGDCAITIS